MSTRATVHFRYGGKTEAIVYRHSDGYPEGLGKALEEFLTECEMLKDSRFDDPSYLAAKWVVADSARNPRGDHRLAFLGVGIVLEDPGDIEYRYLLECSTGRRPKVVVEAV